VTLKNFLRNNFSPSSDRNRQKENGEGVNAPVAFIHVPKCGGTSVRSALSQVGFFHAEAKYHCERAVPPADRVGVNDDISSQIYSVEELQNLHKSGLNVGGHVWSGSVLDAGYQRVWGIVREPRSRILSLYRFWQSINPQTLISQWGDKGRFAVDATGRDLGHFLDCASGRDMDNGIEQYLGGLRNDGCRRLFGRLGGRTAANLEVRLFWNDELISLVNLYETERKVSQNEKLPQLEQLNVTEPKPIVEKLTPNLIHRLDHLTQRDYGFLEYAMSRGWLRERSGTQLNQEFEETARRLQFDLK
jgi:hypothetical protein